MKILVAICTYNRAHLLQQTLEQLTRLQAPQVQDWRLVVIDNNSRDATPEVVRRFTDRLPLDYRFEPRQGLSNARNAAVDHATAWGADYIVWTDDDVVVDADWLAAYVVAFRQYPLAAAFGGRIDPWFEVKAPAWLTAAWTDVRTCYGARDCGPDVVALDPRRDLMPYGANFAIRMDQQVLERFDPNLGVVGNKRLAGEETTVIQNILARGFAGYWLPQVRLRHFVEEERMTLRFVWAYNAGAGHSRRMQSADPSGLRLRLWYLRSGIFGLAKSVWFWPFDRARAVRAILQAAQGLGYAGVVRSSF